MSSIFRLIFALLVKCNTVLDELKKIEARLDALELSQAAIEGEFVAVNQKLDQIIALLGTPPSGKVANSNPSYGHPHKSTRRT